ncbi:unnamed protein product, partial [Iphiclides podalirius]
MLLAACESDAFCASQPVPVGTRAGHVTPLTSILTSGCGSVAAPACLLAAYLSRNTLHAHTSDLASSSRPPRTPLQCFKSNIAYAISLCTKRTRPSF